MFNHTVISNTNIYNRLLQRHLKRSYTCPSSMSSWVNHGYRCHYLKTSTSHSWDLQTVTEALGGSGASRFSPYIDLLIAMPQPSVKGSFHSDIGP